MSVTLHAQPAHLVLPADAPREEWLAARRRGIGGSDALAVAGLDPWKSRLEVYLDKTGDAPERIQTDRMRWGQIVEAALLEWFTGRTAIGVTRCGLLRHADRPWQMVTLDAYAADGGIVECKNTGYHRARAEWDSGQVADGAECQVQHGLAVTGSTHAWVVAQLGGEPPVIRRVDRDEAFIADLTAIESEFWDLIEARTPPALDGSAATTDLLTRLYPVSSGRQIRITPAAFKALLAFRDAQQAKKDAEARATEARNLILDALGDAEAGLIDGRDKPAVTWRNTGPFDAERFRRDHPEVAARYTRRVDALDVDALKTNEPELHAAYRARRLLVAKDI